MDCTVQPGQMKETIPRSLRALVHAIFAICPLFGDWQLALAAYNWGEGRVARIMRRTGIRDFWTMSDRGLLPQETANYVPSVLAASRLLLGPGKQLTEVETLSQ